MFTARVKINKQFFRLDIQYFSYLCEKIAEQILSNSRFIMMIILSIVLLSFSVSCQSQQKFLYGTNETITVERNSIFQYQLSLTTASDEYLSEASIETVLKLTQNTSIFYNFIYFNYQNPEGHQCYQNWIVNNIQPPQAKCQQNILNPYNIPSCINFTQCFQDDITFTLGLSQEQYIQSYIIIQNTNPETELVIFTQIQMQLSSENTWFYWGVGLTCILLITLVIYAGIIFYWLLKYKKTKKMFEQFKLTEQEESIKKDN